MFSQLAIYNCLNISVRDLYNGLISELHLRTPDTLI